MRQRLFVITFCTGLALMLMSRQYQPRAASATPPTPAPPARPVVEPTPNAAAVQTPVNVPESRRIRRITRREIELPPVLPILASDEEPAASEAAETNLPAVSANTAAAPSTDLDAPIATEPVAVSGPAIGTPVPPDESLPDLSLALELDDITPPEPARETESVLTASAGTDRKEWAGAGPIKLDASASEGAGLLYLWEQVNGPPIEITGTEAPIAWAHPDPETAASWAEQVYEFRLTVTDADGHSATDTVKVRTWSAPDLRLIAMDSGNTLYDKYFDDYAGASVPHFVSHVSLRVDEGALFVIDSAAPLTFDQLAGGPFEMTYSGEKSRHLYHFHVYQPSGSTAEQLELFCQTDEGIPAVVIMSVEWR